MYQFQFTKSVPIVWIDFHFLTIVDTLYIISGLPIVHSSLRRLSSQWSNMIGFLEIHFRREVRILSRVRYPTTKQKYTTQFSVSNMMSCQCHLFRVLKGRVVVCIARDLHLHVSSAIYYFLFQWRSNLNHQSANLIYSVIIFNQDGFEIPILISHQIF